ncbi:HAD-IC family P-type ATPase, partial [Synechococcus sp. CCY9201]|uniref:HAD-IC family P-type ATPase n=1 Tax=Synechococcus sp. CCY9201 TaxID=174697 RepID=UPI002B21401F
EALLAALALALAVLPNEIPVVLALFLALGALRLARIGVLARWPAAVESLGSATVLAVDKTGTLTENRMGVQQLLTWPELEGWQAGDPLEEPFHALVELAVLASRGDPVDAMELAIQRLAADQLSGTEHLHPDWPLERDYPLQSDLLVFSRLWHNNEGGLQLAAKGAPEAIADLCHLDARQTMALLAAADGLAARGLRVLAVARGLDGVPVHEGQPFASGGALPEHVHGYLFEPVGFLALADPLRPDVPVAIATARGAGVRVVMITGDSPVTARSIADQAGLPPGRVLSGPELDALTPQDLAASIGEVSVFARVMPQQKLQLVRALQAAGEVVAMTGDGVNDAPALKAADIGVAMGKRGTAVARESADLVLLNDTFSDLVAALELGRRVDANLHRALGYTLAIHLPIAALGLVPLLLPSQALILLPVHIALLHLVIDPACTVVFEALPATPGLMRQPPRPPQAPLFGPDTWRHSLSQGAVVMVAALVLVFWPEADAATHRSLVFSLLLLAGGGLVWLNGDPHSRITAAGAGIGLGLWLLLLAIPGLQQGLSLAPMQPAEILTVMITTAVALLLAGLLNRQLS